MHELEPDAKTEDTALSIVTNFVIDLEAMDVCNKSQQFKYVQISFCKDSSRVRMFKSFVVASLFLILLVGT